MRGSGKPKESLRRDEGLTDALVAISCLSRSGGDELTSFMGYQFGPDGVEPGRSTAWDAEPGSRVGGGPLGFPDYAWALEASRFLRLAGSER